MINFSIDELKQMRETFTQVEETLEQQKKQVEVLIDSYKEEMRIEEALSFDAYHANRALIAVGVEYYEDVYGEINITKERISEFNKSVTHFLADMIGLDDGTKERLGYLSEKDPDFSLSALEIGGKDDAIAYRREGEQPLEEARNVPGNNKPLPPNVHFRSEIPETDPKEELKYAGEVKETFPLPPPLTPGTPYWDVNVEEALKDQRVRDELFDASGNIKREIIEEGGAAFSMEEAVAQAQRRVKEKYRE